MLYDAGMIHPEEKSMAVEPDSGESLGGDGHDTPIVLPPDLQELPAVEQAAEEN